MAMLISGLYVVERVANYTIEFGVYSEYNERCGLMYQFSKQLIP